MPKPVSKRKKVVRKSPKSNQVFFGLMVLSLLLALIVVGKILATLNSIGQPYTPDSPQIHQKIIWEGNETLNLLIKSSSYSVLSFNPVEKSVVIFNLPEEAYLNLPYAFGKWPLRSVYGLGQAENPAIGAELLQDSVSMVLGLPLSGYVLLGSLSEKDTEEFLQQIKDDPFGGWGIVKSTKTNLSPKELWSLLSGLREVRSDKVEVVDLTSSRAVKVSNLPDGSQALSFDQVLLDQLIQNKTADSSLKDGGLTVGIFNTTNHSGLAEKAARVVTNLGGRVVFTASPGEYLETTVVEGKSSFTTKLLTKIFAAKCLEKKCSLSSSSFDLSRADVNIILGEDYFLRYNAR